MFRRSEYSRSLSLILAMLVLLLFQMDILPPVFGVTLPLALPFVVAVGMTEGPYLAAGLGVAAGLILDQGRTSAYGFSALLLLVVGTAAGLFISYFRLRSVTAALFTLIAALFCYPLRWFFLYYLWHGADGFFRFVPLQILYATLLSIPLFYLVCALSRRFGSLRKADRLTPKAN